MRASMDENEIKESSGAPMETEQTVSIDMDATAAVEELMSETLTCTDINEAVYLNLEVAPINGETLWAIEECILPGPYHVSEGGSHTTEKTSSIESEQEIADEIGNQALIPAGEVTEVVGYIRGTDRSPDNLVDKEENKSQEAMKGDKNNSNSSEDNCDEEYNRLEESFVEPM